MMLIEQLESRRLLASAVAGVMDSTFGLGGVVITDFKTNRPTESVRQVIPMSDGRVLAIGNVVPHGDEGYSFRWAALARYNADGSFDAAFGNGGATNQKLGALKSFGADGGMILSDGKILVVGAAVKANQDPDLPDDSAMALIRYTADGVLDTTFGTGGYVFFDDMNVMGGATRVIALPGDKMLFTAFAPKSTVVCVNGDGTLDSAFGTGGIADVGPTAFSSPFFLARRSDGKLLLYNILPDPSLPDGATATQTITRLTADGHLDTTFGDGDGVASTGLVQSADLMAQAMDAAPDGGAYLYVFRRPEGVWKAQLLKLTPVGQLDTSFGEEGFASVTYDGASFFRPEAIKVQADGRILAAGQTQPGTGEDYDFNDLLVARFNPDGSPDTTFGNAGARRVQSDAEQQSFLLSMALASDGNIFLGGYADEHFLVAKMLNNAPPPDASVLLGDDGTLTITGSAQRDVIAIDSLSLGKITVTFGGVEQAFTSLDVVRIAVLAGDGNDSVNGVNLAARDISGEDIRVTIDGGAGDDVLLGHQGRDRILGAAGNDKIHGAAGDDWLSGNSQKDRINGGDGNDSIFGNGGGDRLEGSAGNDTVLGGDQPDGLAGGEGDDSLMGEGGHDRIDGGAGLDFMSGGGGNDIFYARDTEIDDIVGGVAGLDRAQADEDDVLVGIEQELA
jgi:uncharacterized delta-60 repeat protein